jgi:hypothetical protein
MTVKLLNHADLLPMCQVLPLGWLQGTLVSPLKAQNYHSSSNCVMQYTHDLLKGLVKPQIKEVWVCSWLLQFSMRCVMEFCLLHL